MFILDYRLKTLKTLMTKTDVIETACYNPLKNGTHRYKNSKKMALKR